MNPSHANTRNFAARFGPVKTETAPLMIRIAPVPGTGAPGSTLKRKWRKASAIRSPCWSYTKASAPCAIR